jgi:hypothetical protein
MAAVHHQKNHAVATPHIRLIECRNGVVCDDREINCLLILGVRDVPNLEATPKSLLLKGKRHAPSDVTLAAFHLSQYVRSRAEKAA